MQNSVLGTPEKEVKEYGVLHPMFYIEQMKGWSKTSYTMLVVGLAIIAFTTFGLNVPLNNLTWFTYFASSLGWATVISIKEAKNLNGLFAIISSGLYIYVAWVHKNPADAMLQLTYILILDIPVLLMPSWVKDAHKNVRFIHETDIRGEKHGKTFWYSVIGVVAVVSFIGAYLFETLVLHTPRPISDSLVLGTGIVGAILTTFRFSESWFAWIIQGAMQIVLWGLTVRAGGAMSDTALIVLVTYLMYFANDILAVIQSPWFNHKQYNEEALLKNKGEA